MCACVRVAEFNIPLHACSVEIPPAGSVSGDIAFAARNGAPSSSPPALGYVPSTLPAHVYQRSPVLLECTSFVCLFVGMRSCTADTVEALFPMHKQGITRTAQMYHVYTHMYVACVHYV